MKPAPIIKAGNAAGVVVTTTAETVAATVQGISTEAGGDTVQLEGQLEVTVGTAGTSVVLKIERGSAAGSTLVIADTAVNVAAGNTVNLSINGSDSPGEVAGQSYILTVTVGAATGNSTVTQAQLNASY